VSTCPYSSSSGGAEPVYMRKYRFLHIFTLIVLAEFSVVCGKNNIRDGKWRITLWRIYSVHTVHTVIILIYILKYNNNMHATSGGNVTPARAVCTKITETEIIRGILRKWDRRPDDTSHAETRNGPLAIKLTDY